MLCHGWLTSWQRRAPRDGDTSGGAHRHCWLRDHGPGHNYGYRAAPVLTELAAIPRVVVIAGREGAAVAAAAARYDIPQWTTDWRELVRRPDIDVVEYARPLGRMLR